jgi:chromosomal replication initiator protein
MIIQTTPQKLSLIICDYFNIDQIELTKKSNKAHIAHVRHLYCYLAHEYTNLTFNEIGDTITRDHSTVIHSVNKIKVLKEIYTKVRSDIEEISAKICLHNCVVKNIDLLEISKLNTLSQSFFNL